MTRNLNSWHGEWAGFRVAVLGVGASGFSAIDTLVELGAEVRVFAKKVEPEYSEILDVLQVPVTLSDSVQDFENLNWSAELVIVSPGFPPHQELVAHFSNQGIRLWTDIDLAWHVRDKVKIAKWITITGTNGKTTTTELAAAMLESAGYRVAACGNIGNPILDAIRDPAGFDYLVVELSSFQLHYLDAISPVSSAFLNLADDHIDWHGSFDAYGKAKAKVYENTQIACVYNAADAATERYLENADVIEGCRAIGFTAGHPAISMVGYVEDILVDRAFVENRQNEALEIARHEDYQGIGVVSPHLMQNLAAATALARSVGVTPDQIAQAMRNFKLAPHRIEMVAQIGGVDYVDDSKATNVHAARASLRSFDKVVWICGGLLKGVDPAPLVKEFSGKISAAIVIGADTSVFENLFAKLSPVTPIFVMPNSEDVMQRAVLKASEISKPGETVLLAPAAASMDQFRDYGDRGDKFKAAVFSLGGEK